MALHGWRLFGVAGTVFAYIAGILFLSVMNMQNPHPRRPRLGRFGEINSIRNRDISGLNRRQPIQWCTELKFLDGNPIDLHHYRKRPLTKSVFDPFAGRKNFVIRYKKIFKLSSGTSNSIKTTEVNPVDGGKNEPSSGKEEQQLDRPQLERTTAKPNQGDPNSKLTALASFPGSGNTWLRYLLQQATGILTGSIYKDYGLLKSGFPAENICNKSVLVVKTHEWGPNAWKQFAKAILLIRDPDKSILAEFNRQSGGHVGFASPDRYKRTRGRYWQQFVGNKLMGWENMNLAWAKNFTGNLKIVYYDDLVADVEGTLREILTFLNFPINEDLLACAIKRKEGIYRRKKRVLPFDPYSPNMKKYLEDKKHNIYKTLGRRT